MPNRNICLTQTIQFWIAASYSQEKLEGSSAKYFHFHKTDMFEEGPCEAAVKACVEAFGGVLVSFSNAKG